MNIFVVYDKSGIHSGRALGDGLAASMGTMHTVETGRPDKLAQLVAAGRKFDFVVNVGCFTHLETGDAVVLNKPGSIGLSSNKLRARLRFVEKSIAAPTLWQDAYAIPDSAFPVIARTTHHSKGRGFWFCKNTAAAVAASTPGARTTNVLITTRKGARVWRPRSVVSSGATHFIKYIDNTREFRVHVMSKSPELSSEYDDLSVLKLSEKVPGDGGSKSNIIKNVDNGWVFSFPENLEDPILDLVRVEAKKAIAACNLHWGAVDIVLAGGKVYVLEINSTPCLTDDTANTIDKYLRGIRRLVGLRSAKKPQELIDVPPPARRPTTKLVPLLNRIGL